MSYIVFQDNLKGLIEMRELRGETLEETLTKITSHPNQRYMYFIYRLHEEKVPLFFTRFDVYRYVKAVAGSKAVPTSCLNKQGLEYALTHQTSMAWLFCDNLF